MLNHLIRSLQKACISTRNTSCCSLSTMCFQFLLFFFALLDLASFVRWLCCLILLSVASHWLRSALNSTKHIRCGGAAALSFPSSIVKKRRSFPSSSLDLMSRPHAPPSLVHVTHEFLACECKGVQIDIRERDRHVHTHIHCENRSLIHSLALMRSAIKG